MDKIATMRQNNAQTRNLFAEPYAFNAINRLTRTRSARTTGMRCNGYFRRRNPPERNCRQVRQANKPTNRPPHRVASRSSAERTKYPKQVFWLPDRTTVSPSRPVQASGVKKRSFRLQRAITAADFHRVPYSPGIDNAGRFGCTTLELSGSRFLSTAS